MAELTPEEFKRFLHLRAVEWANWPSFLSPLYLPVALIFLSWPVVLIGQVILGVIWCTMRYARPDIEAATRWAIRVQKFKWIVAVVGFLGLAVQRQPILACIALAWPLVSGVLFFGGEVGKIDQGFLDQKAGAGTV
jgi:hypothetical protein